MNLTHQETAFVYYYEDTENLAGELQRNDSNGHTIGNSESNYSLNSLVEWFFNAFS